MPLESLTSIGTNLRDLSLESLRSQQLSAREQYERLQRSAFFDQEKGLWKSWVKENGDSNEYSIDSQLLGIFVESAFHKQQALESFRTLKQKYFRQGSWREIDPDSTKPHKQSSMEELLSILAHGQFDKNEARKMYEALKETDLYDPERREWNYAIGESAIPRFVDAQMLGVLVESLFSLEEASAHYVAMKADPLLYNEKKQRWNHMFNVDEERAIKEENVSCQLFGVLAEAQWNLAGAQARYSTLKSTQLYDSQRKLWKTGVRTSSADSWPLDNQLLGILCERLGEEQQVGIETTGICTLLK